MDSLFALRTAGVCMSFEETTLSFVAWRLGRWGSLRLSAAEAGVPGSGAD